MNVTTVFGREKYTSQTRPRYFMSLYTAAAPLKAQTRSLLSAVDHHHLLNIGQKLLKSAEVSAVAQERAVCHLLIVLRSPSWNPPFFLNRASVAVTRRLLPTTTALETVQPSELWPNLRADLAHP